MASAFFASPFDESAILSIDGIWRFLHLPMIGVGRGTTIEGPWTCNLSTTHWGIF